MREKLYKILYTGVTDLREQLFRLILIVSLSVSAAATLAGSSLENGFINTVFMCCMFIIIVIASVATFKYHKLEFAAIWFAVLIVCVIFPIMFFISGGIQGGAAVWFVLGLLYMFLMFQGKKLILFLCLAAAADIVTYAAAYQRPDSIIEFHLKSEMYFDSLFAVLVVGIAVGLIMQFQIHLYEKERELTLKQKSEIEEISRSKDVFFTNMSHEIRTPINTIIGLNEMILREDISDEVAEDAVNVKNASKMLLNLINDILDFSQIESGRMVIVPVQYRTKELFSEVVDLIRVRMREKKLDFYINIDSGLPSVLSGDEVRIKQILINLLTNAVKYTPQGSVTFAAHGETIDEHMVRLKISVTDTGLGIKKEDLETLYDYFKRVDQEKNRQIEGNGLGLAITRQLVSLMGGRITVDSIYTKGSVFTVILDQPIVDAKPVGRMGYLEKMRGRGRSYYKQSFEAPNAKILVVDDNETNLMVIEKLMRATKVQIDKAADGEECLERTKKKIYHVILLDSMMPGKDGIETLKEIRHQKNGLCRQTPVIALTADAAPGSGQKYLESGFDSYLAKPVDGSRMEAEILKFLPEELLEYQIEEERQKAAAAAQIVSRRKRKKIQISTDCVSDLSQEYLDRYDLKVMYLYIQTEKGIFRDTEEIDSDNLSRYLSDGGSEALAVSAPVEEYEAFYAEALTEAEELVHISMAANAGQSYSSAVMAAKGFDNVHVIDASHISGGEGLLVLAAANLLARGCNSVEELCRELDEVKRLIESSFLIPNVRNLYAGGYTSRIAAALCERFDLHPEVRTCQSGLKLTGLRIGKLEHAKKRYIRGRLRRKSRIDTRAVLITYAGCTLKQQQEFTDEVLKYIPFKKVIIQRASVSCASNGGLGSMGMAYLLKRKGGSTVEYEWTGDNETRRIQKPGIRQDE